jgi:hypothetical protein
MISYEHRNFLWILQMVENCLNSQMVISFSRRILLHRFNNIYVLHILTNVILRLVIKTCKIHSAAWIPWTFYFKFLDAIKKGQPEKEVLLNCVRIINKHVTWLYALHTPCSLIISLLFLQLLLLLPLKKKHVFWYSNAAFVSKISATVWLTFEVYGYEYRPLWGRFLLLLLWSVAINILEWTRYT